MSSCTLLRREGTLFIFFKRNDNCIFLGIIPSFKLMVFSCRQTICFQQHLNELYLAPPLILKVVAALISGSIQRKVFTPLRGNGHQLADLIHHVPILGCFDDDFIVNMTYDIQAIAFHPGHCFCQNVTGNRLCRILHQPAGVGFLSGPFVVLPHSFIGQTHPSEAVRLQSRLQAWLVITNFKAKEKQSHSTHYATARKSLFYSAKQETL